MENLSDMAKAVIKMSRTARKFVTAAEKKKQKATTSSRKALDQKKRGALSRREYRLLSIAKQLQLLAERAADALKMPEESKGRKVAKAAPTRSRKPAAPKAAAPKAAPARRGRPPKIVVIDTLGKAVRAPRKSKVDAAAAVDAVLGV